MTVVTRFPPSPTGMMHIGTARTALFNWLFAKNQGGKMVFRIEDTDRARHSEEAVEALIKATQWLGLDWDGEIISQYSRKDRHAEVAKQLLDSGKAYHCYCSPEELEDMRETAKKKGRATFYDRRWRDKPASDAPAGIEPVIRIKAPLEGQSTVHDKVQGDITIENTQLDDFIILRSDGTPTYMLAVMVDDHDMGVTHVIRGDDHTNNTFRQNVLYDALGWEKPVYAHLPLIHGPDGAKMSKRHGAASVEEYKDMGYLPEAMRNYLLRLGWSHGDDEIISDAQAIEWFNLEHIGKSPARFDFDKLESVNAHYMKHLDPAYILDQAAPFFEKLYGQSLDEHARGLILAHGEEIFDRSKTLIDLVHDTVFYLHAPTEFDEKAAPMISAENKDVFEALLDRLPKLEAYDSAAIQGLCKEIAKEFRGGKMGMIGMPFRASLTGKAASPGIFKAAEVLGLDETLKRLQAALARL